MANPLDLYAIEDLRFMTQMRIGLAIPPHGDILEPLQRHYPKEELKRELASGPSIDQEIEIIPQVVRTRRTFRISSALRNCRWSFG